MNPPSIVVLDGHALNPGDLDWTELASLGSCAIHPRTAPADVVARCHGAAIVLTNKTPLNATAIAALPHLRYIGVLATGYNVVDVAAARTRGIAVANVPEYGTHAVAQHVFALLLELTQRTGHHAAAVRQGRWTAGPDWCFWDGNLIELAGRKLGIVGRGRIGEAVGRLGQAFGMEVLFAGRTDGNTGLKRVLREADVLSLHCPLTAQTQRCIDARTLGLMKPTAFLLNTSRGGLVDEPALAAALNENRLAGAALDVLSSEPPAADSPLLTARNCLITPHIAWAAGAARARLMATAIANVRAFLAGTPRNLVG